MQRPLMLEDFAHRVGESFSIAEHGLTDLPLKLTEADPLRANWEGNSRPAFSLVFVGDDSRVLEQRMYRFDLSGVGTVDIFLVPIGRSKEGVSYHAVFN